MYRTESAPTDRPARAARPATLLALALILLAATAAPRKASAEVSFAAPFLPFETGVMPTSVAIADLDGDGNPDLVSTNAGEYPPTVSVLLGRGNGTFRPKTDFPAGNNPASVAIGDFNDDGIPDIVLVNTGTSIAADSTVSVLLGLGGGSFGAPVTFATRVGPISVAIAEINGDGRPDLVVIHGGEAPKFTGSVSVLFGTGDGKFVEAANYPTRSKPASMALGDLNADGRSDLVVTNYGTDEAPDSTVSVRLANADGTFGNEIVYDARMWPGSVAIGDLNRDGRPDLVVSSYLYGQVSALPGNGDGTFGEKTDIFQSGGIPSRMCIADVNGDGKPDITMALYGGMRRAMGVVLGNGDGTFGPLQDFGPVVPSWPPSGELGDVNRDGKPDFVTGNGIRTLCVFIGNGDGTFGHSLQFPVYAAPTYVGIADLNADGRRDVVATTWNGVEVLPGHGDGTLDWYSETPTGSVPRGLAIGDLNGDGRSDVVVANSAQYPAIDSTVSVLLGNGDGTFAPKMEVVMGPAPGRLVIGDVNRDGKPDLLAVNGGAPADNSTVSLVLGNGDGTFRHRMDLLTAGWISDVAIADIDHDGLLDLVVAGPEGSAAVLPGNGDGSFRSGPGVPMQRRPTSVRIADLDGDGAPDLVFAHGDTAVSVFRSRGNGTFEAEQEFRTGGSSYWIEIADMDGDGKPDLVTDDLMASSVTVVSGNGDASFGATTSFGTGTYPLGLALGDMNGDGKPDIVTADWLSHTVTVLLNRSTTPPTPTLLELFRALPVADGVRIEWTLGNPGALRSVELQRGAATDGAWSRVTRAQRVEGRVTSVLDDALTPDETRWYRLGGVQSDGSAITFAPVPVAALGAITAFTLSPLTPNPTRGHALVTYAIPSRARVRLALLDVQGREVARLADGMREPGRYTAALEAGDLRAGMYFVRMQAGGVTRTRRMVVIP